MLVTAFFLVAIIRVCLWVLPFNRLRTMVYRWLKHDKSVRNEAINHELVRKVAWSIKAVSRRIPDATCLPQALAAIVMLSRLRQDARLLIGVALSERGRLEAHAWVECDGRVVVGKVRNLPRFTVLNALGESIL